MTFDKLIDEVFGEMKASSFCSCHEGDLNDRYWAGVQTFKKLFAKKFLHWVARALEAKTD